MRQREARQKLDEAMLRRCVHSSAMIGTLTHLDTLISVTRHTRKSAMLWLGCHSAKLAKLDEKLKTEQALGKWTFTMSKWTVEPVLKKRSELFADKKADGAPAGGDAFPGGDAGLPLKLPGAE